MLSIYYHCWHPINAIIKKKKKVSTYMHLEAYTVKPVRLNTSVHWTPADIEHFFIPRQLPIIKYRNATSVHWTPAYLEHWTPNPVPSRSFNLCTLNIDQPNGVFYWFLFKFVKHWTLLILCVFVFLLIKDQIKSHQGLFTFLHWTKINRMGCFTSFYSNLINIEHFCCFLLVND